MSKKKNGHARNRKKSGEREILLPVRPPLVLCPICKSGLRILSQKLACPERHCSYNKNLEEMRGKAWLYGDLMDAVRQIDAWRKNNGRGE